MLESDIRERAEPLLILRKCVDRDPMGDTIVMVVRHVSYMN